MTHVGSCFFVELEKSPCTLPVFALFLYSPVNCLLSPTWSDMRIVSWNVNGLRAVLKNTGKSLKQFLDDFEAEIICLQETKATSRELGHCIVQEAHFFSTQRNS